MKADVIIGLIMGVCLYIAAGVLVITAIVFIVMIIKALIEIFL